LNQKKDTQNTYIVNDNNNNKNKVWNTTTHDQMDTAELQIFDFVDVLYKGDWVSAFVADKTSKICVFETDLIRFSVDLEKLKWRVQKQTPFEKEQQLARQHQVCLLALFL
jgi:hypothetical protein